MVNVISTDTALGILRQVHPWWGPFMERMFTEVQFNDIIRQVVADRRVLCPLPSEIFRVLQLPPDRIRVIIIGQDPYILGEAHGLAFSSCKGITPSLRQIFNEIARTEGRLRTRFRLDDWEEQGVFLINTNLTTVMRKSLAHNTIGWQWFTGRVLKELDANIKGPLVVIAWGAHARKVARVNITNTIWRLFLEWTHPAARFQEFTGNSHFRLANKHLLECRLTPIDWAGPDYKPVLKPDYSHGSEEVPDVPLSGDSNADSPDVQGLPGRDMGA